MIGWMWLVSQISSRDLLGERRLLRKKIQQSEKNSSTIPGSWMVSGHCGMILDQGRLVWVTLSGQEDGCDLFESRQCCGMCTVPLLGSNLGRHANSQARRMRSISESAHILLERSYTRLG